MADFDTELPEIAIWVFTLSDAFVNFWFVAAFPLPFLAVVDYHVMRWMTQQLGLRWTAVCTLGLTLAIVLPVAAQYAVLQWATQGDLNELS